MNILILGLGSIGQRHLRNINNLNGKFNFFAVRKKFITPALDVKNKVIKTDLRKKYKIKYLKNLSQILKDKIKIDAAFICTPSNYHIKEAIWLLKNNINIFVEKPLGSNLIKLSTLKRILDQKTNLKNMMGYQLKFNPIIKKISYLLKKRTVGKLNNIFIHHGEHINDFHPYEDYRISYAARKDLGGGVILCQIHEIDYILYLFSDYKIKILNSYHTRISNLKINVEDTVVSNFILSRKNSKAICTMHLNFFERPKKRSIQIIGEKGKINADLNSGNIFVHRNSSKKVFKFKFDRNKIFKNQVKYFINCIKNGKKIDRKYDLKNGIKSLELAMKLKDIRK